jgi:hypothetical protein
MNPDNEYYPKSGWFFKNEKYPRFGGYSFNLGLAKNLTEHCTDGYDNPITHTGYEYSLYANIFDRQIEVGFKTVRNV